MRAADSARAETGAWVAIHQLAVAVTDAGIDPLPNEESVTGHHASRDLARRAGRWNYTFPDDGLDELSRFAAALTVAEAEAWESGDRIVATTALEHRRFLFSDRIVHWAVPFADVAGRCHPHLRADAHRLRDMLLDLGDRFRPAPILTGDEGLHPPGEDAYGPTGGGNLVERLGTLLSGTIVFQSTAESLVGADHGRWFTADELSDASLAADLASMYHNAAARWMAMSRARAGTARLWRDLALRASSTATMLEGVKYRQVT